MGRKWQSLIIVIFLISIINIQATQTGWKFSGIPAVNYNADDGFGYGAIGSLFNYRDGGYKPYYIKFNSYILNTTGGKQIFSIFIDSPYLPNENYRFNTRFQLRNEANYPYYGPGNDSEFKQDYIDEDSEDYRGNKYYYFHKQQWKLLVHLQKNLYSISKDVKGLSGLVGFGSSQSDNSLKTNGGNPTKLEQDTATGVVSDKEFNDGLSNFLKFGLIYDTRHREVNPSKGCWTSLLAEWHSKHSEGSLILSA